MTDDKRDNPFPSEPPSDQALPRSFRLPSFAFRLCFRVLASLQLAVALIAIYVVVLAGATFIEKYDGTAAARDTVYGAGWFTAINILLAVNVLCAMLIRFPWRRRQVGFLVAHGGILVLLAGCAATRWAGVEARLPVYEGHANHIAWIDDRQGDAPDGRSKRLELGFQVYLQQFRRKLDPGSRTPSHFSSRVDFLELSDPPKKLREEKRLQEDVLITLNAPADFTDPRTGRTYRLFQADCPELWLPGDAEFDELAGDDHGRDQVFLSVLSVNYDPGRWPKYAGSFLVVVGIGIVYYLRGGGGGRKGEGGRGKAEGRLVLGIAVLLSLGSSAHAENEPLDWSAWRHLPTFGEGRVAPLDTYARETVEAICGRADPALLRPDAPPDGRPRKFDAAELLFAWLVEPEKWEKVAFLPAADEELRREIGLPLEDADGRRLRCVSPDFVENSDAVGIRWTDLVRRADAGGKDFQTTAADKKFKSLVDAYGTYRTVTFSPGSPHVVPREFSARVRLAKDALYRLIGDLQVSQRISGDAEIRERMVAAGESWRKLMAGMHGSDFSSSAIMPLAAAFHRAADRLATRLASPNDAALTALAANLRHQAAQMHLALYDGGGTLRLVPALDTGALEENRTPDDDASPWLSFQALMYGSDDLLEAYPRPELLAARKAFSEAKAAYVDRGAAGRAARFAVAMNRFAESLRTLAAKIEPLRERLPLRHRDRELIGATAYPPPGSSDVEVFYNRLDPFFWSWVVSLAATLCLLLAVGHWQKPLFWLGAAVLTAGQGFAIVGMGFRGYITGLVPLTGMFETVEFVALYAGLLGLWFALKPLWGRASNEGSAVHCSLNCPPNPPPTCMDLVVQRRLFAVAGAIVGFTAAALAYYAPATVMHRNLGAVTPILRDNFWLAVHVVTIMASYASAAIALILGFIALGYYLFGRYGTESGVVRRPSEACGVLAGFIYTAIQITVLLLAAGTILGALWADKAWGHFWNWDPKEVWALVSLLAYVLILHIRKLGWSGDFGMAVTAVFGFTAILFTYYGVNFVLGTGMHSYGSGAGGLWAVASATGFAWLFLLAAAVRRHIEIEGWK